MDVIKTYDGKQLAAYSDVNGRRLELTIDDDNKVSAIGGRELAGSSSVELVAGPGVAIDNPDGNTLRISMAKDDETELYFGHENVTELNLPESVFNFKYLLVSSGAAIDARPNPLQVIPVDQITLAGNHLNVSSSYYESGDTYLFTSSWNVSENGKKITLADGNNRTGLVVWGATNNINSYVNNEYNGYIQRIVGVHRLNGIGPSDTVEGLPVREYTAGPGIIIDPVNKTISAPAAEEVVLWEGTASSTNTAITLSENLKNFSHVKLYVSGTYATGFSPTILESPVEDGKDIRGFAVSDDGSATYLSSWRLAVNGATLTITRGRVTTLKSGGVSISEASATGSFPTYISKVVGVSRISS